MNRFVAWSIASLLLFGCATKPPATEKPASAADDAPATVTSESLSPLQDFNFNRGELPEVLLAAMAETYAAPKDSGCAGLAEEVAALDAVLGEDLDIRPLTGEVDNVVVRALVQAIRGMIPYRGVLRFVTGANRRERRIAAAIAAGSVRRGYLKGIGEARGCEVPAAPSRPVPEAATP